MASGDYLVGDISTPENPADSNKEISQEVVVLVKEEQSLVVIILLVKN